MAMTLARLASLTAAALAGSTLAGSTLAGSTAAGAATRCDAAATQAALNACQARAATAADRALNRAYAAAMTSLSPPSQALLRTAQRRWLAFRDAHCAFVASGGGSVTPMVRAGCLADLSRARASQIAAATTQCPEGDVACAR